MVVGYYYSGVLGNSSAQKFEVHTKPWLSGTQQLEHYIHSENLKILANKLYARKPVGQLRF